MSQRVPLNIPPGLNTGDTAFSAKNGFAFYTIRAGWVDMDKSRFWRERPQTIGGWEKFFATPLTGVCRNILPWSDTAGVLNVAFGTHSNLEVYVGGQLYDITPVAGGYSTGAIDGAGGRGFGTGTYSTGLYSQPSVTDYFPRTWALAAYGQTLMANPRGGKIYQWKNVTGTPAAPLGGAPAQVTFMLVSPKRQVIAFGCNEQISGTYNPLCIRGSDLENATQWIPASDNKSFEEHLDGGGRIVAARLVGDYIFVWTDAMLFQMQFLGDLGQTYRFTRLGDHCGLIGPNAVAISGQTAFWMSPDGNIRSCTVGGEPSIMVCPVQADVYQNLAFSQQDKIVASLIPQFNEVWWFYPDSRDGVEISRYFGVCTLNNQWLHGTFVRTAFDEGSPTQFPIGADYSGYVYLHEKGQSADGQPISWFYESSAQYLDEGDQRIRVKGVWPDFQNQVGSVSLSIYTRGYPQDTDRLKGPFVLTPGQSKKSFMADGRLMRVRVSGNASPTFCRLGTLEFETEGAGLQ